MTHSITNIVFKIQKNNTTKHTHGQPRHHNLEKLIWPAIITVNFGDSILTRYWLNLPRANSIYELRSPVFCQLLSAWYPLPIGSPGCYLIPRFLCLSYLNHIIKHWQFIILEINAQKNVLLIMLDICSLTLSLLMTPIGAAFSTCHSPSDAYARCG